MTTYRAGIIGRTGRGDYGHSLDVAFVDVPGIEVVALADDDPVGRHVVGERTGARTLYADYREMLDKERPDLVAVCPRWTDCHEEMVVAAAEAGAKGILCEKPFAPTPAAADAMLEACDRAGTRVAVAHHRANPYEHHVKRLVDDGAIGDLQVVRSRGKCDWRSGGEDLFVLGSHMMESMRYIAGADAAWGFGHVTKEGSDVTVDDAVEGDEGLGLLAGDVVASYFAFENGVAGHFDSYPADLSERPDWHQGRWFGYEVYGTEGIVSVRNPPRAETYVYPYGQWIAREEDGRWERVVIDEWERDIGLTDRGPALKRSNRIMVDELLRALDEDREVVACASGRDGRAAVEMVMAVHESHRLGRPVPLPLENRENPYETWRREADGTPPARVENGGGN